ncbi:MAG: hypothetical protein AAB347_11880 [Bacteroidota bacterium]
MKKIQITRTYGPIHFEDLDPHRFEDLIRELIYDFKEWQTIEATGRGGSDDGFDIRAIEKLSRDYYTENANMEEVIETHPMEGNLWMIQGKREKEIGPEKIIKILNVVDSEHPPYGYILAASANFSKKSYDVFREILRKKGVMEFYIWGKAELEDMLHLPKNDRILFTFFGISLVSKRKSQITEIRSYVVVKNKMTKLFDDNTNSGKSVLIRDINDVSYPYKEEYHDFNSFPRWIDFSVLEQHPLGVILNTNEYFAYIDDVKKEWDYTDKVDLAYHKKDERTDQNETNYNSIKLIRDYCDFLPKSAQGRLKKYILLKYSDIELIDDKGDRLFDFPHLYVDFKNQKIPFFKEYWLLELNNVEIGMSDNYKRINVFPKDFNIKHLGKFHKNKKIEFNEETLKLYNGYEMEVICCNNNRYEFLNIKDIIEVANNSDTCFLQITFITKMTYEDYFNQSSQKMSFRNSIIAQLGQMPGNDEILTFLEFKRIYSHDLEEMGLNNKD